MKQDIKRIIDDRIKEVEFEWNYFQKLKREQAQSSSSIPISKSLALDEMIMCAERALNELNNLLQVCEDK